jgi:hypothetical protein
LTGPLFRNPIPPEEIADEEIPRREGIGKKPVHRPLSSPERRTSAIV